MTKLIAAIFIAAVGLPLAGGGPASAMAPLVDASSGTIIVIGPFPLEIIDGRRPKIRPSDPVSSRPKRVDLGLFQVDLDSGHVLPSRVERLDTHRDVSPRDAAENRGLRAHLIPSKA